MSAATFEKITFSQKLDLAGKTRATSFSCLNTCVVQVNVLKISIQLFLTSIYLITRALDLHKKVGLKTFPFKRFKNQQNCSYMRHLMIMKITN